MRGGVNEMDWGGSKGSGVEWRRKKESGVTCALTTFHRTGLLLQLTKIMTVHTCEQ